MLRVLLVDAAQAAESLLGAFLLEAGEEDGEGGMGWTGMVHIKDLRWDEK